MTFGTYLKKLRIENALTQKEMSVRINLLGEEFLGIDSVSISRWERGVITPHLVRTIKVLRSLTNDLLPYLVSLPVDSSEFILQNVANSRFNSPYTALSFASYEKQQEELHLEVHPLCDNTNSMKVKSKLENFLNSVGEHYLPRGGFGELYRYQLDNKIFGKRIISTNNQKTVGHLISLFFDLDEMRNYYKSPLLPLPLEKIKPYQEKKPLALYVMSRFGAREDVYWVLNSLLVLFLSTHANIHDIYFYVFDQAGVKYFETLGAEKVSYNTPDPHGMIKIGRQSFKFGVFRLDCATWLARPEVLALLKEIVSNEHDHFVLKSMEDDSLSVFQQLLRAVTLSSAN